MANAGIVSTGPLDEVSDRVWQQLVDTNLTGAFHTLRAAIPVMRRQKFGRIVVTSSMGGRMGIPELGRLQRDEMGCHRPGEVRGPGGRERGNHGQRRLPHYDANTDGATNWR